jgi:hypothetical protein
MPGHFTVYLLGILYNSCEWVVGLNSRAICWYQVQRISVFYVLSNNEDVATSDFLLLVPIAIGDLIFYVDVGLACLLANGSNAHRFVHSVVVSLVHFFVFHLLAILLNFLLAV